MNHERFEELLPAYIDGTLSADERAHVESALAESAALRESLEQFRSLEDALVMRREEVPPVDRFIPAVPAAAVAESTLETASIPAPYSAHEHTRLQGWLRGLVSTPALAIMSCIVVALWVFWNSERIASFLNARAGEQVVVPNLGVLDGLGGSISMLTEILTGGDMMVLIGVYSVVTVAILGLTGYMTMRFVRS